MSGNVNDRLAALPATFTTGEAERAGVWRRELYRLRGVGGLLELSRGVYRKADAPETAYLDLLAVTRRAPRAVVCLVSALSVHDLTDEIPAVVQIAVPRGTYRPRIDYPPTEVSEFDVDTFELGRAHLEVSPGEAVPIYGPARTVVDAMRLRTRIGPQLALRGLRLYLARHDARPTELLAYARALDVEGPIRRAVEAVLS
ncbi:MAG TPA: hypothetical protein VH352_08835 [Pseudonocardiaceae bacterium]|jgi:predicted transcriptional regulator of viral defense system|nr:hypothetical protein [Pseudonocardiaceae bacterium]